jgi:DNA-binding FrmR family transcriptional regulator
MNLLNGVNMIVDIKKRALHRSKILAGQLRGIEKMIEGEEYCIDIITQNLAIQRSIGSLNKLILENHLRTHVEKGMRDGDDDQREQLVEELLRLYELNNLKTK